MEQKTILLVDANNFFAGCEILMNPSLKGRPVCVLSNNDGCVIARSYEAKKLGIPMGIPYFMAKKSYKDVVYLSANFSLYHDISQRMMKYLERYSDKIDIYSIDEAFLDVTDINKIFGLSYKQLAEKIKNDIETEIGISVSVGAANSKILAKMAAHKAKALTGVYMIEKHMIKEELENIPVEEIWGVGKNTARSLKKFGIFYADEILLKEDSFYKKNYGKRGMELKYELMGESVIPLTGIAEKPKSIQKTRAFPVFSSDRNYIKTELYFHLHNVCKKLRENNQEALTIAVMLRTKDFRVFYNEEKLESFVNSEILLANTVDRLFHSIYNPEIIYRSSGIFVSNLRDLQNFQLPLFTSEKNFKGKKISKIIDKFDEKYGRGVLAIGTSGIKNIMEKHKRIMNLKSV